MDSGGNYWTRKGRVTASRRGMLGGTTAAAAGLAAIALTGCGGDDTKPRVGATTAAPTTAGGASSPAAAQPKRGGTNTVAQTTVFTDVMDPHTSLNQAGSLWSYIGNTPLRTKADLTLANELVEKYEIPGNGQEIVLTLRQGVTWHNKPPTNGRAFVGDDLAFNLMRIRGTFNPEKIAQFQRASTLPNLESATAVDEKTVRVKLSAPHSSFVNGLAEWRNSIVPRDFVEKGGKFEDPATMVGTGPFIFDTWDVGKKATWKPNPNYWEKGKPYINQIDWVWYGDRLSSLASFSQGKFDYFEGPTLVEQETLKKLGADVREESWLLANWNHFRFNTTRKPFTDARVRRALFLALDYKAINDGYYGKGYWDYTGPLVAAFPEAIPSAEIAKMAGYNPATKQADIKTAKDLMSAAGYPDGGISFKATPYSIGSFEENVVRAIDQWKAVWPAMKIDIDRAADVTAASRRQSSGDFDMISYIIAPGTDGLIEMQTHFSSKGSRNYGKFIDDKVDSLLTRAQTELDTKTRAATLKEVQLALLETHAPLIHINMYKYGTFFKKTVKGMEGYGTPLGGSSYDTKIATKGMWFDNA